MNNGNDLSAILAQALNEMKRELGDGFDLGKVNLAELERRTGITRARLRRLKKNGFQILPHGLAGRRAETTVLTGYTGVVDSLLMKGVTNSSVIHERLKEAGYGGGVTSVKNYVSAHADLIPAKRQIVSPRETGGGATQPNPERATKWTGGSCKWTRETGVRSRSRASPWCAIAAASGTWSSSPTPILGHASVSTTLDLYVRINLQHKADSLKLLSDLFSV